MYTLKEYSTESVYILTVEAPTNQLHLVGWQDLSIQDSRENTAMSQKRDREEDTMESRKVQKVNNEELRLRKYLEDLDYWKKNTPPSWELLRERYENLVQWDM